MKVLVLNYEYPPVGGGGGRLCRMVAEGLAARGHELRVVTTGMRHLPRDSESGGVRILRPLTPRGAEDTCRVHEMAAYLAMAFPETLRQLATWKPDVIHAHFVVPTGILAAVASVLGRCPMVVTAHLGDVPGGVPEQTRGLFALAAPFARMVWSQAARRTAVSGFVAGLAKDAFGSEARVIPNGIPPVTLAGGPRRPGPPRILMVGRLSVQKNPVLAIGALARLTDLPWELEIIGKGPLEQDVRNAVGTAGLGARVHFAGWLDEAGVRARMADSDILLMPSLHEGLPMAAVEALWHGLAIVGSRIGGLQDVVVDHENGELCTIDAASFAAPLAGLLGDPGRLAACREASLRIARGFDFNKSVVMYEETLRDAAQTRTAASASGLNS